MALINSVRERIFMVRSPQDSILGPLFNFFINDILIFLNTCDICNYADDHTLYSCSRDFHRVQVYLNKDFKILDCF